MKAIKIKDNYMNNENAFKNLLEMKEILEAHDINYWLEAGTCLGAVRDSDFIGHDQDIDIGILAEDCYDVAEVVSLFGSLLSKGFRIHHTFGEITKGYEIAVWKRGIKLDIFWFYLKGDKRWHAAWLNGGRNGESDMIKLVFDANLFQGIKARKMKENKLQFVTSLPEVEFHGVKFPVPNPVEDYLVARYGDTWQVPDKNWDWAKSPKCINNNFEI